MEQIDFEKLKKEVIAKKLLPLMPYLSAPKEVQWDKMFEMFEEAMEEYANQKVSAAIPVIQNAQWVKCAERFPETGSYYCRRTLDNMPYKFIFYFDMRSMDDIDKMACVELGWEWLDESVEDKDLKTKLGLT